MYTADDREKGITLSNHSIEANRRLREQITRFFLLGGDALSLEALEAKAHRSFGFAPLFVPRDQPADITMSAKNS